MDLSFRLFLAGRLSPFSLFLCPLSFRVASLSVLPWLKEPFPAAPRFSPQPPPRRSRAAVPGRPLGRYRIFLPLWALPSLGPGSGPPAAPLPGPGRLPALMVAPCSFSKGTFLFGWVTLPFGDPCPDIWPRYGALSKRPGWRRAGAALPWNSGRGLRPGWVARHQGWGGLGWAGLALAGVGARS